MSASRNKKERKNQVEAPETQSQPAKKGMSRGLKTTLGIVCAVLVVAIVVFFTMVTTASSTPAPLLPSQAATSSPLPWSTTIIAAPCRI